MTGWPCREWIGACLVTLVAATVGGAQTDPGTAPGPASSAATAGTRPLVEARLVARPAPIDMRSAALLVSDQEGGDLPVAVAVHRLPPDVADPGSDRGTDGGETYRVWVRIEIDGAAALEALAAAGSEPMAPTNSLAPAHADRVVVHAYAVGAALEVVDSRSVALPLLAESPEAQRSQEAGLRLSLPLDLPVDLPVDLPETGAPSAAPGRDGPAGAEPGPTTVRILVWAGRALALRQLDVSPIEGPTLLEPRFADAHDWLEVEVGESLRPGPRSENRSEGREGSSLVAGGSASSSVAARPTWRAGQTVEVRFGATGPAPRRALAVLEGRGAERLELPIEELRAVAGPVAGTRGVVGRLRLPPELGEGLYRFLLETESHEPALPLSVAVVSAERPDLPWPRLAGLAPQPSRAAGLDAGTVLLPEEAKKRAEQLRLEILRALADPYEGADGPEAVARLAATLAEIESRALAELGGRGVAVVDEVERELFPALLRRSRRIAQRSARVDTFPAEAVAGNGRGSLLAWSVAHLLMARQLETERRFRLARHALDAALESVRRYAGSSDELGQEAAWVLTLAARRLPPRGQFAAASRLFEEALDHTPEDPHVLYGHALGQERQGRLDEAIELFARVVAAWPEHAEARLRWAVSLQRAERPDEARAQLETLLALDGDQAWITLLAHQQRIRLALDRALATGGDPRKEAARQALDAADQALARFPGDAGSVVARARALDLLGRLDDARAALLVHGPTHDSGPGRSGLDTAAARSRYNGWPEAEFVELRQRLVALAAVRLGVLRQAAREILGVEP